MYMYFPGSPSASILSDVARIQSRLDDLPTSQWKIGGLESEVRNGQNKKRLKDFEAQDEVQRKEMQKKNMILPIGQMFYDKLKLNSY